MSEGIDDLFVGIRKGDRESLARAITLIESSKESDRALSDELLRSCLPYSNDALFIGVTGIPGAGKSTLLNMLGMYFIDSGKNVAVMAVDPSSARSKGSIMGDKTRMDELSRSEHAFIRPSPTSGMLGGVSRMTRESSYLCAAAGYDIVFIETVGVGQNELDIDDLADFTLLLLLSGTGDELQGIKRGIMEAADIITINKVEESDLKKGKATAMQLRNALSLLPARDSGLKAKVFTSSAISGRGVDELCEHIRELAVTLKDRGVITQRRTLRKKQWLNQRIEDALLRKLNDPKLQEELKRLASSVDQGETDPISASAEFLEFMETDPGTPS